MAGASAHRGEHARIIYPAAFELREYYPLARIFQLNCHCRRHCIDTPANG
ncbi:MAG: hypothetical protein WA993_00255 [Candidatus Binatus sp.]